MRVGQPCLVARGGRGTRRMGARSLSAKKEKEKEESRDSPLSFYLLKLAQACEEIFLDLALGIGWRCETALHQAEVFVAEELFAQLDRDA
jgi:hypothetical protein